MCQSKLKGGDRCDSPSAKIAKLTKYGLTKGAAVRTGDGINVRSTLDAQWNTWEPVLTDDEKTHLFDYSNQDYEHINGVIRDPEYAIDLKKYNPEAYKKALSQTVELDRILASCPPAEKPRTLYRSIRPPGDPKDAAAWAKETFVPGQQVTFESFSSMTANPNALIPMLHQAPVFSRMFSPTEEEKALTPNDQPSNTVFEVVTRKGAPVHTLSHMPQEAEILAPRNMTMTVLSVREDVVYESQQHILRENETTPLQQRTVRVIQLVDVDL